MRTDFKDWTYEETGTPFDTIVCRAYTKSIGNRPNTVELSMQYEIVDRNVSDLMMIITNVGEEFLSKNMTIEIKTALHPDTWEITEFEIKNAKTLRINSFQKVRSDKDLDQSTWLWFLLVKDWTKNIYIRIENDDNSVNLTFSTHTFYDAKSYMEDRLGL